jgi:Putative polyhydroxyalkanoic acid system protein (PHA_gran_rgn)
MSSLRVEYPLGSLSKDDAKARLTALGEYFQNKHGIAVAWNGDAAQIRGKYMVVQIEGSLAFAGDKAVFDGKDPGFLWRGKAKEYLQNKLAAYLDPKKTLEDLPRR